MIMSIVFHREGRNRNSLPLPVWQVCSGWQSGAGYCRGRTGQQGHLYLFCEFHLFGNSRIFQQCFLFLLALQFFGLHLGIYFYSLGQLPCKAGEEIDKGLGKKSDDGS